jgi:hypothetical protein
MKKLLLVVILLLVSIPAAAEMGDIQIVGKYGVVASKTSGCLYSLGAEVTETDKKVQLDFAVALLTSDLDKLIKLGADGHIVVVQKGTKVFVKAVANYGPPISSKRDMLLVGVELPDGRNATLFREHVEY